MNIIISRTYLSAALAAFTALALCGGASAAGEYQRLVEGLRAASAENGITRVAVGAFSASGGAAEEEARFASETTMSGLAADRSLQVLDQAALESQAGPKESWLRALPSRLRPQAFIKGSVFKEGDTVTVVARLVETSTGRVLSSLEARSKARFSAAAPAAGSISDIDWGAPLSLAAAPDPFRDAPSDAEFDCAAAFKGMDRVNAKAADLKARYWAARMKEPGFVSGSLSRNPGSEIRDSQVKQQFYERLTEYHARNTPALSPDQTRKLEEFMARENSVIDRCGMK